MTTTVLEPSFSTRSITKASANELIAKAHIAAAAIGIKVSIAVTDAAGHLTAFGRDDGAAFLSADVAIDKAWTVSAFGLGTHIWSDVITDPKVAQLAHRPRLVAVGGGCPIIDKGQVIGGIGISGGNALQDQEAAEQALRALGFEVK